VHRCRQRGRRTAPVSSTQCCCWAGPHLPASLPPCLHPVAGALPQMCQKQCRDENGFKCHLTSESHKRQMEVFGQAPQRIIDGFSEEFEEMFLEHLRRAHPFSRISANVVYNEFIQDRQHVHMNSTKWETLTDFIAHLGREGKCKVDDTPKGWYIMIVQRDPNEELEEQRRGKREKAEQEEGERDRRALEAQIEKARQAAAAGGGDAPAEDGAGAAEVRPEDLEQLGFRLAASRAVAADKPQLQRQQQPGKRPAAAFDDGEDGTARPTYVHKRSKVEELMERDLRAKQHAAANAVAAAAAAPAAGGPPREAPWLAEGIVVKVVSKALQEHGYYKQKGEVLRVLDRLVGEIEMAGSGDVVRVDQKELQTVVPQPGGAVRVVAGPRRGARGKLVSIDEKRFQAEVALPGVGADEEDRVWLDYEHFSKLAGK